MTNQTSSDDLIQVAVPRRLYPLVLRVLADGMTPPTAGAAVFPAVPTVRDTTAEVHIPWTADDIRTLRRLLTNPTQRALMELTCAKAGRRISFTDVKEAAGTSHGQARADLAGLTKVIRQHLGRSNWPVDVKQTGNGTLTYDVTPEIAAAWIGAE
jgi:hypothetical protein